MLLPGFTRFIAALVFAVGVCRVARADEPPMRPTIPASTSAAATTAAPRENRLAHETSPYLLQHAHNPVDWFPWGDEAFEEARRRDVPILLSIGYSTCYWCHVMERESFEDEATAKLLNERMVAIKVDREERPDVDEIYMTACQIFTQLTEGRSSGGWPLTVMLEPKTLRPFFVGTYYPPREMHGRIAFPTLITAIADAWRDRRDDVLTQAERLSGLVREQLGETTATRALGEPTVREAVGTLMRLYDSEHGGFGAAPKFPQPVFLDLLLRAQPDNATVREALRSTADGMAIGGLFDQVGGGFHRYCVDGTWTVPHFEKMLYDNGQLASFYATLVERNGDAFHAETLRRTLEYVLREMTAPDGAFYSAQDAEVDGREGGNYVWTTGELRHAATDAGGEPMWRVVQALYGVNDGASPNFRDPHHPEAPPAWVLRLAARPDAPDGVAAQLKLSADEFARQRAALDAALKRLRDARKQPRLDDKVIVSWNGLMIAGMADGGRALKEPRFVAAAARAANAVLATQRTPDGGLLRIRRGDRSRVPAFLEDYAMLAFGLLALHRADGDPRWLREAAALADAAMARFRDPRGGFFDTLEGQGDLFVRTRSLGDGAVPSGNSTMLHVLLDLYERAGEGRWLDEAANALAGLSGTIAENPLGAAFAVSAVDRLAKLRPELLPRDGRSPAGADRLANAAFKLRAEPSEIVLGEEPARVEIVLTLPEGVHVNAHDPQPERPAGAGKSMFVGIGVELDSGDGIVLDVDYPRGEALALQVDPDDPAEVVRVHRGTVRIPIRIRRTGEILGAPSLILTFQPCTDRECLAPIRRAVPVTIRR